MLICTIKRMAGSSLVRVSVTCDIYITFNQSDAKRSLCPFLTDPKPDMTVNFDEDFNIVCLIRESVSPDTTCNLYVGEESQPSFTAKIKKRKPLSASIQWFCQFFPNNSDLISRPQSVRSKEVSCDYRVSSGPNSLSPRSDGKSFAHLVGVHIGDPTSKLFPAAGSTVSSTLTPNTPVRPTTNSSTKCLTSPLTPSTAVNPSSGSTVNSSQTTDTPSKGQSSTDIVVNSNSPESVPDSTVTSTLITGITVRPTTSLTSPLTPSTAVNATSVVQLWQAAVGLASGVGVFLMGLTAVSLCRRTKKTNSQRPTARQDDHRQWDLLMGAVSSAGMLDSRDAGIYSLITYVPSTLLPSCPVEENGKSSENDNLNS
ncbi:uncharacterized protein ACWYII_040244 isoform 2-T3 [Salvelinus alpinus]